MDLKSEEFTYYKAKHVTCLIYRKKQPIISLYPTFCGVEQCKPAFAVGPRARNNYHLHVILSGKGVLRVGERTSHLHGNQAFLLKPHETAFYQADEKDPWHYCWVSFNGPAAKRYMDAAGFLDGVNSRDCFIDANEFLMLTWRLLECGESSIQNELRRLSLTMEFIALMIESGARVAQPRRHDDSADMYVDHALDVIRCNYANIKIRDIARHIGINRSYLTNIFKKRTGLSPQEYLLRYRLNMACRLLLTTSQPIQEVARKIGYENPMTFSKMFKNAYGVSPSGYRLQGAPSDLQSVSGNVLPDLQSVPDAAAPDSQSVSGNVLSDLRNVPDNAAPDGAAQFPSKEKIDGPHPNRQGGILT